MAEWGGAESGSGGASGLACARRADSRPGGGAANFSRGPGAQSRAARGLPRTRGRRGDSRGRRGDSRRRAEGRREGGSYERRGGAAGGTGSLPASIFLLARVRMGEEEAENG